MKKKIIFFLNHTQNIIILKIKIKKKNFLIKLFFRLDINRQKEVYKLCRQGLYIYLFILGFNIAVLQSK